MGPPAEQPQDVVAVATQLRGVALRLSRRLRKHSGPTLTWTQMSMLTTLRRQGALRIGELARREQLQKSSVTRGIARLEALGYLTRQDDPQDGRSQTVDLTAAGTALLDAADERANAYLVQQLVSLPPEDRQAIADALPALARLVVQRP